MQVKFLGGQIQPIPRKYRRNRQVFVVVDPCQVELWEGDACLCSFIIPAEFTTDGASMPWYLQWLWKSWDERIGWPCAFHDWLLYEMNLDYKKRQIDIWFLIALYSMGVPDFQAICLFGGARFAKDDDRGTQT